MRIKRVVVTDGTPEAGIPRWAWWAVFLAILMFTVPLTSPWWSTVLRGEVPDAPDESGEESVTPAKDGLAPSATGDAPGSTLRLTVRTRDTAGSSLVSVEREVPYVRGVLPQIQAALTALSLAGPEGPALLPEGTRVLDVAFTKTGTLFADFSPELDAGRAIGPDEERMLAEGIVSTVTANFAAVRRVVILVDGRAPTPFHLDLTRPLRADDPLFAPEPEPDASPSPSPSPAGL